MIVPDHAVDAQSLVALADLVVSAGGTMNREAVALGTPVYTTYGGRLGGVDEALIRESAPAPPDRPARARAGEARRRGPADPARSRAAGRHDPRGGRVTAAAKLAAVPGAAAGRRPARSAAPEPSTHESLAERYARDGARGAASARASTSRCARST